MVVESMEMAPGAIPHPSRVPGQRLLSLEIGLRWQRRCGTLFGKTPTPLGFLRRRLYIGGGAMSEDTRVAHTTWWHGQGWTRATLWCGQPLAPLRVSFGLHLVFRKIGTSGFVSSNSGNISCVTFLKHKNSKKKELAL
jgi:hypothetical protein